MGLETLTSCKDKAKLTCKWWYKLASMSAERYHHQEWKVKPRRGRQREPWNKYMYVHVGELFEVLGLHQGE